MGRQPADKLARKRKPQGRGAIWAEIRKQKTFTRRSLADATDINTKTIGDYLESLVAAEILSRDTYDTGTWFYELINDRGREAPRVRKDGSEVTQGRGTEQLWRAMRILKKFTAQELALSASTTSHPVSLAQAKDYCKHLTKAGYLRVTVPGRGGKPSQFLLVKTTGPLAPMVQRVKQVFDPNLGKVVHEDTFGGQS